MGDGLARTTPERIIDWRGNGYEVGDTVVYARQSGHSVQLVEGKVLEFTTVKSGWNEGKLVVLIQPTASSRWRAHYSEKPVRITVLENITKVDS